MRRYEFDITHNSSISYGHYHIGEWLCFRVEAHVSQNYTHLNGQTCLQRYPDPLKFMENYYISSLLETPVNNILAKKDLSLLFLNLLSYLCKILLVLHMGFRYANLQ